MAVAFGEADRLPQDLLSMNIDEAARLTLIDLPPGVLSRIVQAADAHSPRQLRLTSKIVRPVVDALTKSITFTAYCLPSLLPRGHLPDFLPSLRSIKLALQDCTTPAACLPQLQQLGLQGLTGLESLTLSLSQGHVFPSSAIPSLASLIPPSTTRLVLTHSLRGTSGGGSDATASGEESTRLDLTALLHLLRLCPSIRQVRLLEGCWIHSRGDVRALMELTNPELAGCSTMPPRTALAVGTSTPALQSRHDNHTTSCPSTSTSTATNSAVSAKREVVVHSLRGLRICPDGDLQRDLPYMLSALRGLRELDVMLQPPPLPPHLLQLPAQAAADLGVNVEFTAEALAALAQAAAEHVVHMQMSEASQQLLRGLMPVRQPTVVPEPGLGSHITRLVLCDIRGSIEGLLEGLPGRLPLLAALGLHALQDMRQLGPRQLRLLSLLPRLRHLAVDRLD
ncbi:hypothetical protein Agub_g6180, partial [Astrephomene gubernaculifera]